MCTSDCVDGCIACWEDAGALSADCMCADTEEYKEDTHSCELKPTPVPTNDMSDGDGETEEVSESVSANILKFTQFCMIALILVLSYMI